MLSKAAIIIPCYKVYPKLCSVLKDIDACSWKGKVVVVDDNCPQNSIKDSVETYLKTAVPDSLSIIYIKCTKNAGVGEAWQKGLRYAFDQDIDYFIKIDGDDQHRLSDIIEHINNFDQNLSRSHEVSILLKGNRFFSYQSIRNIPPLRLAGNICLSFLSRLSSGNWGISDPVCGCFLINRPLATVLINQKLSSRYLFESDLIHKSTEEDALILEFPMPARYADEKSNLRIRYNTIPFLSFHIRNLFKRIIMRHVIQQLTPEGIFFIGFISCSFLSTALLFYIYFKYLSNTLQTPLGTVILFLLLAQSSLILFVNFLKEDSSAYQQNQKNHKTLFVPK